MALHPNLLCNMTTLMMNPTDKTKTTNGSTFRPGDSSVYNPAQTSQHRVLHEQSPTFVRS